jgi:outer membrane lipopolysaccharide assembly protein LptE/RlpB
MDYKLQGGTTQTGTWSSNANDNSLQRESRKALESSEITTSDNCKLEKHQWMLNLGNCGERHGLKHLGVSGELGKHLDQMGN